MSTSSRQLCFSLPCAIAHRVIQSGRVERGGGGGSKLLLLLLQLGCHCDVAAETEVLTHRHTHRRARRGIRQHMLQWKQN